jgi:hypothetical protein
MGDRNGLPCSWPYSRSASGCRPWAWRSRSSLARPVGTPVPGKTASAGRPQRLMQRKTWGRGVSLTKPNAVKELERRGRGTQAERDWGEPADRSKRVSRGQRWGSRPHIELRLLAVRPGEGIRRATTHLEGRDRLRAGGR